MIQHIQPCRAHLPRPPSPSIFCLPTRGDLLPTRELPVDRGFEDDDSCLGSGTGSDVGNWGTGVRDRDFDRVCIPAALIAPGGTSVVCVAAVFCELSGVGCTTVIPGWC
jgi:hypothetical protein